ncbi:MAG: adenylate kinase [Bdellovibrionales bacterium]
MNILLFGPPGAGKGTQSELLKSELNMTHISTGDLFRAAMKNGTELGKKAKSFMDSGQLVPDSITIGMVKEAFETLGGKSFILDGFPRNKAQAQALETLLRETRLELDKAIFLNVPSQQIIDRLSGRRVCEKCGATYHVVTSPPKAEGTCDKCSGKVIQRSDDRKEVIEERLRVYEGNTKPLKEYYEQSGCLVEIDGTGATRDVFERLKVEVG